MIKLKAWDNNNNRFAGFNGRCWSSELGQHIEPSYRTENDKKEFILLDKFYYSEDRDITWIRCTDFIDNNNNEIWEGDILENGLGERMLIKFEFGCFFLLLYTVDGVKNIPMYMCKTFGRIIGNKFENLNILGAYKNEDKNS